MKANEDGARKMPKIEVDNAIQEVPETAEKSHLPLKSSEKKNDSEIKKQLANIPVINYL